MDLVNAIPKYFEEISRDVQYLTQSKVGDRERLYLIVSIALRALGGFLFFNTARCIVAALVSPLTLIGSVASAIAAFVIARDLLVVGNGMRALFEKTKDEPPSADADRSFFSWDLGKGDGIAPGYNDTMIIRPVNLLWDRAKAILENKPA